MRFFAFALSFFLILTAHPVMSSSVLLPDDNNSDSPSINLGLRPTAPTPTPLPTAPSESQTDLSNQSPLTKEQLVLLDRMSIKFRNPNDPREMAAVIQQLTPEQRKALIKASHSSILSNEPIALSPGGTIAPTTLTEEQAAAQAILNKTSSQQSHTASRMELFAEKVRQEIESQKKKVVVPPVFLDEIKTASLDDSAYQASMLIEVIPTYLWGEKDVRLLERSLGYTAKTIPQNCQIRIDATLKTTDDKAPYMGQIFSGQRKILKYNGNFQQASFKARAFCIPPKELPPNAGIITRSGDKYSILLSGLEAKCEPNKKSPSIGAIIVQYNGNGQVSCNFQ